MSSLNFRALCAELVALLDCFGSTFNIPIEAPVVTRARAALAQSEAEGPTDEEIMELMPQEFRDDLATAASCVAPNWTKAAGACRVVLNAGAVKHCRAVLARWGCRPAIELTDDQLMEAWEWPEYEPMSRADTIIQLREFLARIRPPATL